MLIFFLVSIISRAHRTSSAARTLLAWFAVIPRSVLFGARGALITICRGARYCGALLLKKSPDCGVRCLAGVALNACGRGYVRYCT